MIWIQDFELEISFLLYFIFEKYNIFHGKLDKKYISPFGHFLISFRIPSILSWQYGFHFNDAMSNFVQRLFIRWWYKFNSPISLEFLARLSLEPILSEWVAASTRWIDTPKKSPTVLNETHHDGLSPNVYLQFLQVKQKNPCLTDDDAIIIDKSLVFPPSSQVPLS